MSFGIEERRALWIFSQGQLQIENCWALPPSALGELPGYRGRNRGVGGMCEINLASGEVDYLSKDCYHHP